MVSRFSRPCDVVAVSVQRASAAAAVVASQLPFHAAAPALDSVAKRRFAVASSFLDIDDFSAHASSDPTGIGTSASPELLRRRGRQIANTSFEEEEAAEPEGKKEDVDTCFNKKGQVCNADEVGVDPHLQMKLDAQNDQLRMMMHHGFCSDPQIEVQEECEKEGGDWHEMEGPTLDQEIHIADMLAYRTRKTVEREAADYGHAYEELESAYKDFKKEVTVWQQSISGLEDDYALFCRPFHDVTMQCEGKFRQSLRWWFAREPLPNCEVGVVTPYLRNKTRGAISFAMTDLDAVSSWSHF